MLTFIMCYSVPTNSVGNTIQYLKQDFISMYTSIIYKLSFKN